MKEDNIHLHQEFEFKKSKLVLLMIPGLVFVLVLVLYVTFSSYYSPTHSAFSSEDNSIVSQDKTFHKVIIGEKTIEVEIADNDESRALGLGNRDFMEENRGMLFDFNGRKVPVRFWMKGMKIPLDMIFIADGKVVQITENAEPEPGVPDNMLASYVSNSAVHYVLEVNAGFSARNGIKVGDSVTVNR